MKIGELKTGIKNMPAQIINHENNIEAVKKVSTTKVCLISFFMWLPCQFWDCFKASLNHATFEHKPSFHLFAENFPCLKLRCHCKKWSLTTGLVSMSPTVQMKWHNISMWSMQRLNLLFIPTRVKNLNVQNVFLADQNNARHVYEEHF